MIKKWTPVLSISAVIIFFIWGFIEGNYSHSWIAFFIVPLGMAILKATEKKDDSGEGGE